jgi:hypothetical protein
MLTKLFSLLLAILIAWYLGPWLTTIFWFLPVKELASAISLRNILSHDASFFVSFLLWFAVFWTILKGGGLTVLMAGPQRYGNTKLVRRAQGLIVEGLFLFLFMSPIIALLVLSGMGKNIILSRLQTDLGPAFLEPTTARMRSQLERIDQSLNGNASRQSELKIERAWEGFKDWFRVPENRGEETARIENQMDRLTRVNLDLQGDRRVRQSEITEFIKAYERGDRYSTEVARDMMWGDILASPWRLVFLAVQYLWWWTLPIAAPLYFRFNRHFKFAVARLCAPVLRFFEQGRFGEGGSGKFAGIFDEMALIYSRREK